MKLQEVMANPVPFKWSKKTELEYRAHFVSSEIGYNVHFENKYKTDIWHITFEIHRGTSDKSKLGKTSLDKPYGRGMIPMGVYDIIGSGNAYEVFATLNSIIIDFIKIRKPDTLEFTAEEPSRQKLYKRMVIKFAKKLGYKIRTMSHDGVFRVVKT